VHAQAAGEAFCESEVEVQPPRTVKMSKNFKWYGTDFAMDQKEQLQMIAAFCSGDKKDALMKLAKSSENAVIAYKEYDWSPNSK
jgi:hypothetical protein